MTAPVHFRAGGRQGRYRDDRQGFLRDEPVFLAVADQIPGVAVIKAAAAMTLVLSIALSRCFHAKVVIL